MTEFICKYCDYKTSFRSNYKRHLNSNKHNTSLIKYRATMKNDKNNLICEPVLTQNESFLTQNEPFLTQNEPFLTQKSSISEKKTYFCEFCNKNFSSKSHLTRHIKLNCKAKKEKDKEELSADKKEIAELKGQINKLIDKVGNKTYHTHIGNTTNNNKTETNNTLNLDNSVNNNVNLNVFGKENLEMVTDEVKKELIKGPYKMMPKLLQMIYFNKDFPENHTMKMVNKNKDIMKIHDKDGWKLVDKADTIDYVLEDKNYEVDNFYDQNSDEFSQFVKRTYKNFRRLFDNRDKELWKQIKRDVDLLLWNNM